MAAANIYIEGYISNWDYYDCCSLKAVRESLVVQAPYDSVNVYINSCGGEVVEGMAIYDFIKSTLNVPVTTIANGYCCSIATVIFMAGATRLIAENASFMVHQVSLEGWSSATADELRDYADLMDKYRDQIIKIYEQSGQTSEDLLAMMEAETWLDGQETKDKGFATGIYSTVTNRADLRRRMLNFKPGLRTAKPSTTPQTNNKSMATTANKQPSVVEKAQNAAQRLMNILLGKPVNLAVPLQDDTSVYVDTTGDAAAVGDKVYSDEAMTTAAADGTYTLESGATITVADGAISSMADAPSNEVETLRTENANLKTENATIKKEFADFKGTVTNELKTIREALGDTHSKDPDLTNNSGRTTVTNARNTKEAPKNAIERKRERDEQAKAKA